MATQVEIVNEALIKLGEKTISAITDSSTQAEAANAIYDDVLEECLTMGPEKGWKFARKRRWVDISETDISAFTDYNATVEDTTQVTATLHGLETGDYVCIEDTTNYNNTYECTKINDDSFYIEEEFAGDDATGTCRWTSQEYAYRFSLPTLLKAVYVGAGGIELTDWLQEGQYILTNQESETIDVAYIQSVSTTTQFPPHFRKVLYSKLAVHLCYKLVQNSAMYERLLSEFEQIILPRAISRDEGKKYVQESSSSWVNIGRTTTTIE